MVFFSFFVGGNGEVCNIGCPICSEEGYRFYPLGNNGSDDESSFLERLVEELNATMFENSFGLSGGNLLENPNLLRRISQGYFNKTIMVNLVSFLQLQTGRRISSLSREDLEGIGKREANNPISPSLRDVLSYLSSFKIIIISDGNTQAPSFEAATQSYVFWFRLLRDRSLSFLQDAEYQTCDAQILNGSYALSSDVGICGRFKRNLDDGRIMVTGVRRGVKSLPKFGCDLVYNGGGGNRTGPRRGKFIARFFFQRQGDEVYLHMKRCSSPYGESPFVDVDTGITLPELLGQESILPILDREARRLYASGFQEQISAKNGLKKLADFVRELHHVDISDNLYHRKSWLNRFIPGISSKLLSGVHPCEVCYAAAEVAHRKGLTPAEYQKQFIEYCRAN